MIMFISFREYSLDGCPHGQGRTCTIRNVSKRRTGTNYLIRVMISYIVVFSMAIDDPTMTRNLKQTAFNIQMRTKQSYH